MARGAGARQCRRGGIRARRGGRRRADGRAQRGPDPRARGDVWAGLAAAGRTGRGGDVRASLELVRAEAPELQDWVVARPLRALNADPAWPGLLAAYRWLRSPGARGAWLRQITAPGVDTKFVETHHALLAELLIAGGAEAQPVDGSPGAIGAFAQRFGLRAPERLVHVRFAPEFPGMPKELSEGSFRLAELARLQVGVGTVVIVENLQTFQAWPLPPEGVVIWGAGYLAARLSRLQWVRAAPTCSTRGTSIRTGSRSSVACVPACDTSSRWRWIARPCLPTETGGAASRHPPACTCRT